MKISIGADHAGFELKEHVKGLLTEQGHEIIDLGTDSTEPVDYPPICSVPSSTTNSLTSTRSSI